MLRMTKKLAWLKPFSLTLLLLFCATAGQADDTEIYYNNPNGGGSANVLLLIDNSGGTHQKFKGTPSYDGGKTIDQISHALRGVIDQLSGTARVGVASQLSGGTDGGAINYPVKQINETVDPFAVTQVMQTTGIASQGFTIASSPTPTNAATWDTYSDTATLPFPSITSLGGQEYALGLMLSGLQVPRYAKVISATLTINTPATTPYNNINARIASEQAGAPSAYSVATGLSARAWSDGFDSSGYNATGSIANGKISLNVASVVQNAVGSTFWCGGEGLSLLIEGSDIPVANDPKVYSMTATDAITNELVGGATLQVQWSGTESVTPPTGTTGDDALSCMGGMSYGLNGNADDGSETLTPSNLQTDTAALVLQNVTSGKAINRGDYVGGLRFTNIGLPQGTKVNKATLHLAIDAASGASPTLTVKPILGSTPAFTTSGSIGSASTGTTAVDVAATVGAVDADVTPLVQEVFNGTWAAGNALGFQLVRALGDSISVHALEGGAASAATLELSVLAPSPTNFASSVDSRDAMKAAVIQFSANGGGGNTKPVSSYVEAADYMLGRSPDFGRDYSVSDAFVDSDNSKPYQSPLDVFGQCGNNHIIVVTHADSHGEAFADQINNLVGTGTCSGDAWGCAASVADFLHDPTKNSKQATITTDTVYFGQDATGSVATGLQGVAAAGGGVAKTAANADQLATTLTQLINQITIPNSSMAAPGVAVNQLNRLQYLNQLYYAVFKPKNISVWPGNLKKFALGGTVETPVIEDVNTNNAVDSATGFFKQTAKSYWSTLVDGNEADKGGAKEMLDNAQAALTSGFARKLFVTTAAGAPGSDPAATAVGTTTALTQVTTASGLTAAQLGMPATATAAEVSDVQSWLMNAWGDPLHSEPQLVNYGYTGSDAGAAASDPSLQKNLVFISDNAGILHAIDADTGVERFAFSPIEELAKDGKADGRYSIQRTGAPLLDTTTHQRTTYGLDGTWTLWRRADPDNLASIKSMYAYGGQRRGGSNYYALDVTSAFETSPQPKLLWQIDKTASGPFSLLGQTWSQPQLAKIKLNGTALPVLIFGGGYDTAQDTDGTPSTGDAMGNAVYMVNAWTGALIWYASSGATNLGSTNGYTQDTDMKWSIPASPAVVDADGDGYADFIYAGDMGGQVFRVAIDNFHNTGVTNLVKNVDTFAKLGTSAVAGSNVDNRRFYSPPTVAYSTRNDNPILQLAIGSGYRAHPLSDTVQNNFYGLDDSEALKLLQVIKDGSSAAAITTAAATQPTLLASNLVDVTTLDSTGTVTIDDNTASLGKYGWFLSLDRAVGEKSLSEAAIIQGTVIFTTFTNQSTQLDQCTSVNGGAYLYAVNLADGLAPDGFFAGSTGTHANGRAKSIKTQGIPSKPQVLLTNLPHDNDYTPPANLNPLCGSLATALTGIVGTSSMSFGTVNQCGLQRTGWYESDQTKVKALFQNEGVVYP